jgi:hypothetical protein
MLEVEEEQIGLVKMQLGYNILEGGGGFETIDTPKH